MFAVLGLPTAVIAAVVAAIVAVVFRSRVFGRNEPTETSWVDAWLKAFVIVVFIGFFVGYVPSWIMTTGAVSDLDRNAQDLIGSGFWALALTGSLWGLWYAHREKRV